MFDYTKFREENISPRHRHRCAYLYLSVIYVYDSGFSISLRSCDLYLYILTSLAFQVDILIPDELLDGNSKVFSFSLSTDFTHFLFHIISAISR